MENDMKVQRFDSLPLDATYFTDEGYLVDHPIGRPPRGGRG